MHGPLHVRCTLCTAYAGPCALKFEKMAVSDAVSRVMAVLRSMHEPQGVTVPEPIQVGDAHAIMTPHMRPCDLITAHGLYAGNNNIEARTPWANGMPL